MRRAVMLATLALLLLAVAGVTAAQEGILESADPGMDGPETAAAEESTPTDEESPEVKESGEPAGKGGRPPRAWTGRGRGRPTEGHRLPQGRENANDRRARRGRPPAKRRQPRGVRRRSA